MKLNLVPAKTGVEWVRLGLRTFWRQPLAFASLFFFFMAVISIVSQVPFIGSIAAPILLPFMTLALMVATSVAQASDAPKPTAAAMYMAAAGAMRAEWRRMVTLGLIYAVYFIVAVALSATIDGGVLAKAYLFDAPVTPEMAATAEFQSARLLVMGLNLPLSLAMWHAPALIHWHQVDPVKSLFFSVIALFRNFTAYAMFGLSWLGVFVMAGIGLALLATLLVSLGGGGVATLGNALMVGCALILAAMSLSSTWFTFRDSFTE